MAPEKPTGLKLKSLFGAVAAMAVIAALLAAPAIAADPAAPAAQLQQVIQVHSASFKKDLPATVILPGGYFDPADAAKQYNLMVLLHGAGGDHTDWAAQTDLKAPATQYDVVIVCPTAGPNSWWVDYAGSPPNFADTFVAKELIAALRDKYRIQEPGKYWIAGNSMGGYGALRIGLGHRELFAAIGGLSACIDPARWRGRADKWNLQGAMGPPGGRVYPFTTERVKALAERKGLVLSLICGNRDLFNKENQGAHSALVRGGVEHQWLYVAGNHNWEFWRKYLPVQLEYFHQQTAKQACAGQDAPASQPDKAGDK